MVDGVVYGINKYIQLWFGYNWLKSLMYITYIHYVHSRLRKHVMNPTTWPNPMIIFPEGTCVNNKYTIRFQKGAFELGVKVCPVGIK